MKSYALPHRHGDDSLRAASAHAVFERDGRDLLVIDIAEIDARRIYCQAGYPSIVSYCVEELGLSRKAALHRIHVARVAWRLPAILAALAERRLGLTTASLLAKHATKDNVEELVAIAEKSTKEELRGILAERFPKQDLFARTAREQPSLLRMDEPGAPSGDQPRWDGIDELGRAAPEREMERRSSAIQEPQRPVEILPERFLLKLALERKTHEKLQQARQLLGHQVPSGDLAEILDRVLDVFIARAEKRKFAATSKPRGRETPEPRNGRYIPADVKRTVAERDGRQCTFVSASGRRCPARCMLEFDHIEPVALGGRSTAENLRLRCRTHNQYTAELVYGAEFMRAKLERARKAG
jgi:hypothetical protein